MDAISRAIDLSGGPPVVAKTLTVSQQSVYFYRKGLRKFPVEFCAPLEGMCGGVVRRWEMRPHDWHQIWPELINTPGAPPVPTLENAAREAA